MLRSNNKQSWRRKGKAAECGGKDLQKRKVLSLNGGWMGDGIPVITRGKVPSWEYRSPRKRNSRPSSTRAESVTENRNRYRDILKTETDTDVGIEKKRKNRKPTKKYRKKRKFGFCWWRFTNLKYIHFLPLTLRNEDVSGVNASSRLGGRASWADCPPAWLKRIGGVL